MTNTLTLESLTELAGMHQPPCLSLYQPTHRHRPDNKQDPIRFRNLVKELEKSLLQTYSEVEARAFLEPFEKLANDSAFWNHTLDGLAVLSGSGVFQVYRLQRTVAELAIVANSFHTRPLRRLLQSAGRYQILGLSLRNIQLFEGNRDVLDEVDLEPGVPRTITEALGDELTDPHQTVASYGGVGGTSVPMRHGHGGKKDETDIDAERFFRAVDRALLEHHSRPSGLPLILAALPEHHHLFRKVSLNPFLLESGLNFNPDTVPIDELKDRVWHLVERHYSSRVAALVGEFEQAKSNGLGSDDLASVAKAAADGRVAILLIEIDRHVAGRLDPNTGTIEEADLDHPEVDDLLDDLGDLVRKMGGRVMMISVEQMPGQTGLAAIYRF